MPFWPVFRLSAAAMVATFTAGAQRPTPRPELEARVASIFARYSRTDAPGCAVAAAVDGTTVLSAGYGMADLEHGIAITPDTVFEAASASKQVTAFAVLLLAQQGKLRLDDPIRKYMPELPGYLDGTTIRHLLTHTSGLRDWGSIEEIAGWPRSTRVYTQAHVLEILSRQTALNFSPGTTYSYTNSGYNLAAMVVTRLSGKTLADFSEDEIFVPLGMAATEWRDDFRRVVRNRAIAYNDDGPAPRQDMPFEDAYGHAGLLTTVGDLMKWNQNFVDGKVGGRALIEEQQQPAKLKGGQEISSAMGLNLTAWRGTREIGHSGGTAAYRAWLARYPDQGVSVAVLCNASSANPTDMGRQIAELLVPAPVASGITTAAAAAFRADPVRLQAYSGMYRSTRFPVVREVDFRDSQLWMGSQALRPVEQNVFAAREGRVRFDVDRTGTVLRMRLPGAIDPGDYYETVERANPTAAELRAFAGEYRSDEAEVNWQFVVEGNRLVLLRQPNFEAPLTPTYKDAFSFPGHTVRFVRDAAGNVTALSAGEERVWDLRFRKVR
jgi:CubicO group peptidase (beta-lactamase class C family)